ncbi:MAG TPA: putative sugar nucleotidyl transferase [Gemmataceae bacterium]|nr:putative sugar nucleotidyl transferase [Gemmataceae bacterium]
MRLCMFEDSGIAGLEPLACARPAFDLRCGTATIFEKHVRTFRHTALGALVRPPVARIAARDHPHVTVNESAWLTHGPAILVNARWLPPKRFRLTAPSGPFVAVSGDSIAYAVLTPAELADCTPQNVDACLAAWRARVPNRAADGRLVRHLWDLVEWNGDEIATDFPHLGHDDMDGWPTTLTLVGPSDALWVADTARVDPFVVADTTSGPVVIDHDAVVTSFTRLEGPCYVGRRTQVFAANVRGGTTIGPNCRIGGEVSASILLGNTNKSHEGYLGHSYVGEWVNLGAGTHASDLRIDYATVRVAVGGRAVDTRLTKVGAFIGDHAKAAVGCRLNAGSHIGPFAQLLPCGPLLPKYVPAFCTVDHGRIIARPDPHPLFEAAVRVTARRGGEFTEVDRALYKSLFDRTATHRRTAVHEAELRRLRHG